MMAIVAVVGAASWFTWKRPPDKSRPDSATNASAAASLPATVPASNAASADGFTEWLTNSTDAAELLNTGTRLLGENPAQAALCYRRALELKPEDEEAHFNLGVACARLGQLPEAERSYRAALEIFPEYAEARNNLGNVLTRQKRYEEAIAEFSEVLKIVPDDASAHNNLGRVLAEQGDVTAATKQFMRAATLDTNYFEARFNLGSAFLTLRKTNEAIRALEEALQLRPGFAPVVQMLERLKTPPRSP